MSGEHKTFEDVVKGVIGGHVPTKEELQMGQRAQNLYYNLQDNKVHKCVTKTMAMYTAKVLPELSMERAIELTQTVHTLIATVLLYLIEDGIIKEE